MAKQQEQDPTNLYIANLPSDWTEQNLEELFKPIGMVISTRILRSQSGDSRGVGFARYTPPPTPPPFIDKILIEIKLKNGIA